MWLVVTAFLENLQEFSISVTDRNTDIYFHCFGNTYQKIISFFCEFIAKIILQEYKNYKSYIHLYLYIYSTSTFGINTLKLCLQIPWFVLSNPYEG